MPQTNGVAQLRKKRKQRVHSGVLKALSVVRISPRRFVIAALFREINDVDKSVHGTLQFSVITEPLTHSQVWERLRQEYAELGVHTCAICPACRTSVRLQFAGCTTVANHGPGPDNELVCPGSGALPW